MKRTAALAALLILFPAIASAQFSPQYPPAKTATQGATPTAAPAPPATTATMAAADPSLLLAQISQVSQTTQQDLADLRIERWKTDSSSKEQLQQQASSLQRNLAAALPELLAQVRAHPDDLAASFKLYRNLNALYDVLAPLADVAGRVGPQSDYEALAREASAFDRARRAFADRLESLASAHDAELTRLRAKAPTAAPPASPKKIVIDDTRPVKKASKKSPASKTPTTPQPQ